MARRRKLIYSPFEYDSEALLVLDAKRQVQTQNLVEEIHRLRNERRELPADLQETIEKACDTAYDEGRAHAFAEMRLSIDKQISDANVDDKVQRRMSMLAIARTNAVKERHNQ